MLLLVTYLFFDLASVYLDSLYCYNHFDVYFFFFLGNRMQERLVVMGLWDRSMEIN